MENNITLESVKNDFLMNYDLSSIKTKEKYQKEIDLILTICKCKNLYDLQNFGTENISKFTKYAKENKWKPSTINQRLQVFKMFIKYLNENEIIKNKKIFEVKKVTSTSKVHYTPSQEEIEKFLTYIQEHTNKKRLYVMVRLMLCTGLRRSEITNLKLTDIDKENLTIRVFGKGKKIIAQPITQQMLDLITDYVDSERKDNMIKYIQMGGKDLQYIFVNGIGENVSRKNLTNGNKIDDDAFCKQIKNYARLSGMQNFEQVTPHSLRRYAGTQVYENTKDIKTASEFLRHSSVKTTEQCYIDYNRKTLVAVTQNLFNKNENISQEEKEYRLYLELQKKFG